MKEPNHPPQVLRFDELLLTEVDPGFFVGHGIREWPQLQFLVQPLLDERADDLPVSARSEEDPSGQPPHAARRTDHPAAPAPISESARPRTSENAAMSPGGPSVTRMQSARHGALNAPFTR